MKKIIFTFCILHFAFSISAQETPAQYVNPFIGTGGHGHTFPGVATPFGLAQLSPDTRIDGSWDGCSGYHYSDSVIYGFSHTHLSGTGVSDYGDIMIMPMMGMPSYDNKIYSSKFSHRDEKASAGYYAVKLLDDDIDVELTATTHVGMHKYTFNQAGKASFIVDLNHRDKLLAGVIKIIDNKTIEIYRASEGWAKTQKISARIVFSKPWLEIKNPAEGEFPQANPWDRIIKSAFVFSVNKGETIMAKVSLSPTGVVGAQRNMNEELRHWDFEMVKKSAEAAWNKELRKIEVTDNDDEKKKIFYTALYHCMIHPNIAMDADSMYRGFDDQPHKAVGYAHYTVFSLWDTFRALHPLFTIIDQKRTLNFIKTFLSIYDQSGRLPVWELSSNETDCMIGYHSASVITDAFMKGITDFDKEKALAAMKKSAMWKHNGLPAYLERGYISIEDESESVSKTLEYAYDDWCIAQMAHMMDKREEYVFYTMRSQFWKNIFDKETGFMRPKENGNWLTPFDPKRVDNNYTEANAWQYTFFVPQDISGMIEAMGGYQKFESKLDELFTTDSKTTGRTQSDITGLIGQYAHGNEPSHHLAYLYNYVGKPWKTQERIHQITKDFYKDSPDGLIGNEDCGQMSAWYVLSSMGLYPVTPGLPVYNLGTPLFSEVKINLENGKVFVIKANNVSDKNFYIQSAKLNGNDYSKAWIEHSEILKGGELIFEMGNIKSTWGSESFNILENSEFMMQLVPAPLIITPGRTFKDSCIIELKAVIPECRIFYTTDNTKPTENSKEYFAPFVVDSTGSIKAIAKNALGEFSFITTANVFKTLNNWSIKIKSTYNSQYTAGGDAGIIDGLRSDANWRKGGWQGYQAQDFEAIVDLGKETTIKKLGAGFLQDTRSWILFPKIAEFEISQDGISFTKIAIIENTVSDTDVNVQIKDFMKIITPQNARFVKVKATNYGTLPSWHQGAGGEAFIFVDELFVE